MEHDLIDRPSEPDVRTQLDAILASDQFCTSKRASEFLQFISEHALRGDRDALKERLIGIEIFHRRSDYDTSSDAIVRVTANDVRKRLLSYDQAHPHDPTRILLPPGSYVPDFVKRTEAVPRPPHDTGNPAASTFADGPHPSATQAASTSALPEPTTVQAPQPAEVERPEPTPHTTPATVDRSEASQTILPPVQPTGAGSSSSRRTLRNVAVAIIAAGCLVLGWVGASLAHRTPLREHNDRFDFYSDLLGPIGSVGPEQTEIALSNPHVVLYRGTSTPKLDKEDELARVEVPADIARQMNATANDIQGNLPYHFLQVDDKNYTGLGEAEAAFSLEEVLGTIGRSARLTQARFLNWDAAREQQLVLLGAPHMSAFAQSSLKESNFVMEHDAIRNLHPQPGEQPVYERQISGAEMVDYGLIWMGKSPSGSRVLVLAGLTSTGTAGAGRFFANPVRMRPVYDQLKALSHGNLAGGWQVLLRIDAREDVPVRTTPIAVRLLGSGEAAAAK